MGIETLSTWTRPGTRSRAGSASKSEKVSESEHGELAQYAAGYTVSWRIICGTQTDALDVE